MADDESKKQPEGKRTLDEGEIESAPTVGRRAALAAIGTAALGATGATGALLSGCIVRTEAPPPQQPVYVQQQPQYQRYYTGVTDGDRGQYADPSGYGRGQPRGYQTGITDSDNGTNGIRDPSGQGRGYHGRPGWQSGVTDSDSGPNSDPAGNGRGVGRSGNTGITDGDSGRYADPAGRGRGRWR